MLWVRQQTWVDSKFIFDQFNGFLTLKHVTFSISHWGILFPRKFLPPDWPVMIKMNPLRNISQPTMMFITWPINRAKSTSVRYCTSRNQTYAHVTARYSFCSGHSSYVQCWVQAQQHLPTYSVMNCLLKSIASVMMVLYRTPTVWGPQWVLQWFIMNLLNLFCPTALTPLFMLSTTLLRS